MITWCVLLLRASNESMNSQVRDKGEKPVVRNIIQARTRDFYLNDGHDFLVIPLSLERVNMRSRLNFGCG